MARHEYPFQSRYVVVDGVRIHYVDEGDGEPVLMVHGQPTWSYLYRKIIPPVAQQRRAVALDLMGFGLSDKPQDRDYSFADHAAILRGFIQTLDLRGLSLVLHDWGGPIGLDYAVHHRGNMKRLVLMNTFASVDFSVPLLFRLAFRAPVVSDILNRRLHLMGRFALRYGVRHPSRVSRETLRCYREPHPSYASRKGVAQFPRLIPVTPRDPAYAPIKAIEDALPSFDIPTLFLIGEHDPVSRFVNPARTAVRMPDARVQVILDAGHFLQEDQPEAVAKAIISFLDEARVARTGGTSAKGAP